MIEFSCKHRFDDGEIKEWVGKVEDIKDYGNYYEIEISVNDVSNTVIVGKYSKGWFLVIPFWDVGVSLEKLDDLTGNIEKLSVVTENEVDGVTIAYALAALNRGIIQNKVSK
ncbi:DUF6618 family protein [Caldanaerobacter subterraneus]|uniref:Uncharacterized protein n=1 Tax=Caldanaerobacter subterraneus TaxID=911092 RepID=A0A7Y2L623_9THEO|nr:DUF6618 family protein [Caldanaerobacter subterraneus]NNG66447.1 hypothetical protein [Caldanaerobacter subterraneus]